MKQELLEYIRRPIPQGLQIVQQSVPIVFFGDIETAKYATIAINPSHREFGTLKGGKRLVDREILGVCDNDKLSIAQAELIYDSLRKYYDKDKNPYWRWFRPLEKLFIEAGISYTSGNLVNLDITPWATSVIWGDLEDEQKDELVSLGEDLTNKILDAGRIRCLFANGRAAINHVERHIAKLETHSFFYLQNKRYEIKVGSIGNIKILGWSNYLQRPPALTPERRKDLIDKIFEMTR